MSTQTVSGRLMRIENLLDAYWPIAEVIQAGGVVTHYDVVHSGRSIVEAIDAGLDEQVFADEFTRQYLATPRIRISQLSPKVRSNKPKVLSDYSLLDCRLANFTIEDYRQHVPKIFEAKTYQDWLKAGYKWEQIVKAYPDIKVRKELGVPMHRVLKEAKKDWDTLLEIMEVYKPSLVRLLRAGYDPLLVQELLRTNLAVKKYLYDSSAARIDEGFISFGDLSVVRDKQDEKQREELYLAGATLKDLVKGRSYEPQFYRLRCWGVSVRDMLDLGYRFKSKA